MKKIIYSFILFCSMVSFIGCEEITTEDTSRLTYYVAFELKGDAIQLVTVNTPFVDPGVNATLKGVDALDRVEVSGSVDANTIGLYKVKYSAVNEDGYSTSISRTVIVCNPAITADMSGTYKVAAGSYRLRAGAKVSFSGYPITVTKVAPGFFSVSDFFGGYYYPRLAASNYTVAYTATGYVALNADNTLSLLSSGVKGWGDALDGMDNAKYDPTAGTIYWESRYAGSTTLMTFFITLIK